MVKVRGGGAGTLLLLFLQAGLMFRKRALESSSHSRFDLSARQKIGLSDCFRLRGWVSSNSDLLNAVPTIRLDAMRAQVCNDGCVRLRACTCVCHGCTTHLVQRRVESSGNSGEGERNSSVLGNTGCSNFALLPNHRLDSTKHVLNIRSNVHETSETVSVALQRAATDITPDVS